MMVHWVEMEILFLFSYVLDLSTQRKHESFWGQIYFLNYKVLVKSKGREEIQEKIIALSLKARILFYRQEDIHGLE